MKEIGINILLLLLFGAFFGCKSEMKAIQEGIRNVSSKDALDSIVNNLDEHTLRNPLLVKDIIKKYEKIGINDQTEIHKIGLRLGSPVYLNVIIIPDLSNRLTKLSGQSDNDIKIILNVYDKFIERINMSKNTDLKDCFRIDLTQETQSIGKPISIKFTNSFNKEKISNEKSNLKKKLLELYGNAANNKIEGNDYVSYFRNQLVEPKLKLSTLNEVWENKVIILTDGYLETRKINFTPINILSKNNPITEIGEKNVKFDVLLGEIHLRDGDEGKNDNLRSYWYNWFKSMGVANIDFSDWWVLKDNTGNLDGLNESISHFMNLKPTAAKKKTIPPYEKKADSQKVTIARPTIPEIKPIEKNLPKPMPKTLSTIKDRDLDGIADNIDKCPDIKGVLANGGCPQKKEAQSDINDKLEKIYKEIEEEERNSGNKDGQHESILE